MALARALVSPTANLHIARLVPLHIQGYIHVGTILIHSCYTKYFTGHAAQLVEANDGYLANESANVMSNLPTEGLPKRCE